MSFGGHKNIPNTIYQIESLVCVSGFFLDLEDNPVRPLQNVSKNLKWWGLG